MFIFLGNYERKNQNNYEIPFWVLPKKMTKIIKNNNSMWLVLSHRNGYSYSL